MKIAVVTSLNQRLFKEYGHQFYETYNWDFDLFTYTEDSDWVAPKGKTVNLMKRHQKKQKGAAAEGIPLRCGSILLQGFRPY